VPEAPTPVVFEAAFFSFQLLQCKLSGTTVFCDLSVVNNDRDRELWIGRMNSYLIDDFNNKVEASRVELANSSNNFLSNSANVFMIKGLKTTGRVVFENVSKGASFAALITISAGGETLNGFEVQYRNVPLGDPALSVIDSPANGAYPAENWLSGAALSTTLADDRGLSGVWSLADSSNSGRSTTYSILYNSTTGETFYDAQNSCGIGRVQESFLAFDYLRKDGQSGGKLTLRLRDPTTLVGMVAPEVGGALPIELKKQPGRGVNEASFKIGGAWRNVSANGSNSARFVFRQRGRPWEISYQADNSEGRGVRIGNKVVLIWNKRGDTGLAGILELVSGGSASLKGYHTNLGQRYELEFSRR
jgi:hypothetical protein